jgi:hypothetical protein
MRHDEGAPWRGGAWLGMIASVSADNFHKNLRKIIVQAHTAASASYGDDTASLVAMSGSE